MTGAQQVPDILPDDATIDDIIHALYIRAKFEHGDQQMLKGQGIFHEQAKQRLARWLK